MGFRFRKSIGAGPFRMNLSKSGIGYSVGTKGFRVTKKASGGIRTTASIPGTGISYTQDYGNKSKFSKNVPIEPAQSLETQNYTWDESNAPIDPGRIIDLLLCLFLGWAGAHKFYRKQKKLGFLYLFTFGLFIFGWWGDAIQMLFQIFGKKKGAPLSTLQKVGSYAIAFLLIMVVGGCNSEQEPAPTPTDPTIATVHTTEAPEKAIEPTIIPEETTEATELPSESATESTEETSDPAVVAIVPVPAETEEVTESIEATEPTVEPTTAPTEEPATQPTTEPTEPESEKYTYVLNTSTKKFHDPWCSSADDIKPKNRKELTTTREDMISRGYQPCKRCYP